MSKRSSATSLRKSWETAMKSTALQTSASSTSAAAAATQKTNQVNKSVKKTRSGRATKVKAKYSDEAGSAGTSENVSSNWNGMSYVDLCRLDRLEDCLDLTIEITNDIVAGDNDDDDYGSDDDDDDGVKKKTRKKRKMNNLQTAAVDKRFKVTPLSSSLIEDYTRSGINSNAHHYLTSLAPPPNKPSTRPPICAVTGLVGKYKDVSNANGARYGSLQALEQIMEKQPSWIGGGGNVQYFESLKYIKSSVEKLG